MAYDRDDGAGTDEPGRRRDSGRHQRLRHDDQDRSAARNPSQGAGCDIGAYETGDVAMQLLKASPKTVKSGTNVTYVAIPRERGAHRRDRSVGGRQAADRPVVRLGASKSGELLVRRTERDVFTRSVPRGHDRSRDDRRTVTAAPLSAITNKATVSAATGDTIAKNDTKTSQIRVK